MVDIGAAPDSIAASLAALVMDDVIMLPVMKKQSVIWNRFFVLIALFI
jgi:hypothetical protein